MSNFLKQSTAVVISFGPFLDKTDGVTEETGLVSALDHATTGIKLSKNGGALTIRHATVTATTYDAYGAYLVTLDTTDTGTVGTLRMAFNEAATCLPVWQDFMILPANVYDSLVGGTDALDVSAIQFAGQTITASGGVTIPAATLASTTNITAGTIATVTTVTNQLTAAQIATGVWQDATAGDFTAASSIGKALYVANVVPGAAGGHFIAGTNAATSITTALTANITGNLSGSVGSVTGAVGSVTGLTAAHLDVAVSSRLATAGYTAPPTAAENATALLDAANGVETGLTPREALRLTSAALAGKISGAETTTVVIRNTADTKDRITATVDADGNRTAITTDLT